MLTLPDICDKLMRLDEVTMLELLGDTQLKTSLPSFMDEIEERADYLEELLDDN
jgi:hypothetical protein